MPKRSSNAKKAAKPATKPQAASSASTSENFDLREIREIVGLMADNDLSYFHLEQHQAKLEIRRGSDMEAARDLLKSLPAQSAAPAMMAAPAAHPPVAVPAGPAAAVVVDSSPAGPTVNSPMVGTFYRSAAPGEKAFASIGDSVDENTTVCIIEAMKVMNEIKAEARGVITRVLAEEGKPVQYGQPLFELKA